MGVFWNRTVLFSLDAVLETDRSVIIVAERDGIGVELVYPNDGEEYARKGGNVRERSLTDDSATDDWVIIEAKFKSTNGRVTRSWMDQTETRGRQMSDEWIRKTIDDMHGSAETEEQVELAQKLENARLQGYIRKEVVVVQNAPRSSSSASGTVSDIGIQNVYIAKIGRVSH